jgi:hypothetical protein
LSINNQESSLIKAKQRGRKRERRGRKEQKGLQRQGKKSQRGKNRKQKKDSDRGPITRTPPKEKEQVFFVKRQWKKTTQRELRKKKDRIKKQRGRGR